MGFLNPAYNESAEFKDGLWEWSYHYSAEGQSGSMRFTAKEEGDSVNWEMFISYDDGQGGSFDNYKVMEGTSSKDGSEGQWTFNALEGDNSTQVAVAKTEWETTSDTQRTITTGIYSEGSLDVSFNYQQNGAEHTMIFEGVGISDTAMVLWNTDTRTGYVIEDGNKMCWDENLTNVPCSGQQSQGLREKMAPDCLQFFYLIQIYLLYPHFKSVGKLNSDSPLFSPRNAG